MPNHNPNGMQLNCTVVKIIHENEKNGYKILKCQTDTNEIVIKGTMPGITEENKLNVTGWWEHTTTYGDQFNVENYQMIMPTNNAEIENYLISNEIEALNPRIIHRIVEKYGDKTFNILDKMPDELAHIRGITPNVLATLREEWPKKRGVNDLAKFMTDHSLDNALTQKIYNKYGSKSKEMLTTNPYCMIDDLGILFKTADHIGHHMGIENNNSNRIMYGIKSILETSQSQGNCYQSKDILIKKGIHNLKTDEKTITDQIENLEKKEMIKIKNDKVYMTDTYNSEQNVAKNLARIINGSETKQYDTKNLSSKIKHLTKQNYSDDQIKAIKTSLKNKISVLTGGPGTGKTTTVNGIVAALSQSGAEVIMAAPTGRAAKRMQESTHKEAKTIHRLLGATAEGVCSINKDNPLKGDVLIIDESSMIDTELMSNLLDAVPDNMKVIFIGDENQLPSVGPGNVLHDMINSKIIPVSNLTEVFRQANDSLIVSNAHNICEGKTITANKKGGDFFFIEMNDPQQIPDKIVSLVKDQIPEKYNISTNDIQVLSPMAPMYTGTTNLNDKLQEALNPDPESINFGKHKYRKNDRIIQVVNNYDKDVMNGDAGVITDININNKSFKANFNGRTIEYKKDDLEEILPAFAITVHKSQGSEYPVVVMPIIDENTVSLQRNLLYTGITRAKDCCILVGSKDAIASAINNTKQKDRQTGLIEALQNEVHNYKTPTKTLTTQHNDRIKIAISELGIAETTEPKEQKTKKSLWSMLFS